MMEGTKQAKPGASQLSRAAETKQESKEKGFLWKEGCGSIKNTVLSLRVAMASASFSLLPHWDIDLKSCQPFLCRNQH